MVIDFNDKQIEKREHRAGGTPMVVPDVSEVIPVPSTPTTKTAKKTVKSAKRVPKR